MMTIESELRAPWISTFFQNKQGSLHRVLKRFLKEEINMNHDAIKLIRLNEGCSRQALHFSHVIAKQNAFSPPI